MYAKAYASYSELLKKFPKGKALQDVALFNQGECFYNQGKKKEAVAPYEQMVKEYPKSSLRCDALYALGFTHEELSQFPQAGVNYDLFLKECATSPLVTEVKMRKAETVLQAGQFAEAEKQFGEVAAVAGFAQADFALKRQALCLAKLDKNPEAAALYGKLTTSFPQSSYVNEALLNAGVCLYKAEKLPEASVFFQKVVDAKTADSPQGAHWLCRILIKTKKPAEAVAIADKVLPTAKESAFFVNLKMDRADALYDTADKRAEALAAYLQIVAEHPAHELAPEALYNAAIGFLETKKYDEGFKHAGDFESLRYSSACARQWKYIQAECELLSGKNAEAEKSYRALTKEYPSHVDIDLWQARLGLSIYLQGEEVRRNSPDHESDPSLR